MSDSTERRIIEYEHARNKAMDAWFEARARFGIVRSPDHEKIFEGGFRMAYDAANARVEELE